MGRLSSFGSLTQHYQAVIGSLPKALTSDERLRVRQSVPMSPALGSLQQLPQVRHVAHDYVSLPCLCLPTRHLQLNRVPLPFSSTPPPMHPAHLDRYSLLLCAVCGGRRVCTCVRARACVCVAGRHLFVHVHVHDHIPHLTITCHMPHVTCHMALLCRAATGQGRRALS